MNDAGRQHKRAWEYDAYNFWVEHNGTPEVRAKEDAENPEKMLRKYAAYFDRYEGIKIANICGSCGKKAIPLALLGADVTVFDISEENRRYAMETAQAANVSIHYAVGDVMDIDLGQYGGTFDSLLKPGGKMICSDFHPFIKIMDTLKLETQTMNYFSTDVFEGEMAHARFYDKDIREQFPKCLYRRYTISEIINAIISNGFTLKRFDEHPAWEDNTLPGEFTAVAIK